MFNDEDINNMQLHNCEGYTEDERESYKYNLASNSNTPKYILIMLVNDENIAVSSEALKNLQNISN